jgi:aminoglycoside 6'-N-acetyltransferase
MSGPEVTLRVMGSEDLELVQRWLSVPHVAKWFLAGSSLEREIGDVRDGVAGRQPMHMLVAVHEEAAIGWCQWYRCDIDPAWAEDVGAGPTDVSIDYAIGDPALCGRGLGTHFVGALVRLVRAEHPGCGIVSDPDERNVPSRRVLEKNGFELVAVRSLPSEPTDDPVAIYRLSGRDPVSAPDERAAFATGVENRATGERTREDM